MKFSRIYLFAVVCFLAFNSSAQNIDSSLNILIAKYPAEKIYIHYDKEFYVAGETIWLKAYLYSDGKPSAISSNFYLQLVNSEGRPVTTKKYPILGAVAKGNIDLPDSLPQGNYYLRAFTPYTLNFDESFVYKKNIFIFNPQTSKTVATAGGSRNINIRFFPESGNMIDGMINVVAFKATDERGMPVDVTGSIKTEDGTNIVSFRSYHDGIGKVQFKAQSEKKYFAEIEINGGQRSFPLPAVQNSGVILKVQDEKGGKMFQLARSEKDKSQFDVLRLVAQIRNRVVYDNEIHFEDYPSVKGHLITDSLPSGILHFTVFDKNGVPLAERLSFVNNREYMTNTNVEVVKSGKEKKAENILELNFPDGLQRSASVSVVDAGGIALNSSDNIYARFLLTSDLKGYIHNAGYYFEKASDSAQIAMDNLMLTHGWSRFDWKKILNKEFPEKKIEDRYLLNISGVVKEAKDKPNVSGGKLNIYTQAEDSTSQSYEVPVHGNGGFVLDSMILLGKTKLYYVYSDNREKQRPALVILDENPLQQLLEVIPADIAASSGAIQLPAAQNAEEMTQRAKFVKTRLDEVKELERVTVKAFSKSRKPIDAVNDKYTTGVFRSMGKENIDNINEPGNDKSMNALDFIKNRVQQLEVQGGKFVNRKNMSLMTGQKWFVQVFINESPVDLPALRVLRVDQIALVKFFEAGFVGVGSSAPGGAVAVYTKENDSEVPSIEKFEFVEYNGYSLTREFFNPDYNSPDVKKDLPDNRTTLYWNPDVYTDLESKKVTLSFFNNDFSRKFKVIAEGFDANGKLIRVEKVIE